MERHSLPPAPKGYRWVFCSAFRHWKSKKILRAKDYGREAWCFLARSPGA
jgi:hypothetical protein